MVAAEQHRWNTFAFVHLGSGVVRAIEQAVGKRVLLGGICMPQRSGQQPRNRIDQHHGRQLTAGQDIIANRPFLIHVRLDETLVDAFVTPGDEDQSLLLRQFANRRLIQASSLRRQVDHLGRSAGSLPGIGQGALQRLDLHHHPGAAAERPVVHRLVAVFGVVPRIPAVQLQETLLYRATGNAVLADGSEHFGEQAENVYPHGLEIRIPVHPHLTGRQVDALHALPGIGQ
ncbi:hypothetical protein D9M71_475720 [compost metagenome]